MRPTSTNNVIGIIGSACVALLVVALVLVVAGWSGGTRAVRAAVSSLERPALGHGAAGGAGTGVVRVFAATDQVRAGVSFQEVNGIADGLGSVWVTGGNAGQNHILYAVDPATSRIAATMELPSRFVINPNDVAIGSGDVWVAVGASVYRVEPTRALSGADVRAFATLPQSNLIADLVIDAGSVWVTDATQGRVYRFAISSGRLEAVVAVGAGAGAMSAGDGGIWVADGDAHTVSRISVPDNRVDSVLTVPGVPGQIAASVGGLWVTDGAGGSVTFLDGASGRALTVPVGAEPTSVAAVGDTVWVANSASGTLSRIDARRHVVVATVPVGARPYAIAADQQGVWVTLLGRPAMMQASSGSAPPQSAAALPEWLVRLCGRR